jgi:hypothetical protein
MIASVNRTSPTKRRTRRTKAQIQTICEAIAEVLEEDHPQSVRHVYYRLSESPFYLVPKDEKGYRTVQRKLLDLRVDVVIPWSWVSDGTRWRRVADSYDSPAEAVRATAEHYRRNLWRRTPVYVEVWCESDSMAGVLIDETDRYNVPLMVSRGFSFLYYVGDWDRSGKLIPEVIERQLREFAPGAEIHFERLLVNPDQIHDWNLPTKPAKRSTHSRGFKGGTVEAEAIPAHITRRLVREAIEQHLDLREVEVLETAEESERAWLMDVAEAMAARA